MSQQKPLNDKKPAEQGDDTPLTVDPTLKPEEASAAYQSAQAKSPGDATARAEADAMADIADELAAEEMEHKAKLEFEVAKSEVMMLPISENFEAGMLDRLEKEAKIKASEFKLNEDLKVKIDIKKPFCCVLKRKTNLAGFISSWRG